MNASENRIFLVFLVLVAAVGLAAYAGEYYMEEESKADNIPPTSTLGTTTSTSTSTASTTASHRTEPPTTTLMKSTTPTSTSTTTTALLANPYLEKFRGKGYRQAFMHIRFFCPSCVPAVFAAVSREPGILSKSMGYQQDVSWIIYDPKAVKLDRVLELAGSSGGVELYNDTMI